MSSQAKEMKVMVTEDSKRMRKIRQLEAREERELQRENALVNKLKEYVRSRNAKATERIATRIQRYEMRLERTHRRVLRNLEDLKSDDLDHRTLESIQRIEDDIGFYLEDINDMASRDEERIVELVDEESWEELEQFVIENLKRDIRRLLEIDKALLEVEDHLL